MATVFSLLFDGLAYGMVLFVIAVGLSVTMGMMGFINLAHGAFAMAGGYVLTVLIKQAGFDVYTGLLVSALVVGAGSIVLERLLYRRVYGGTDVEHVMLTIGILFMVIALITFIFGPEPVAVHLPVELRGNFQIGGVTIPSYRAFIIGVGVVLILLLWLVLERTVLGAKVRAAVDNYRIAQAVGIDVSRLFMLTFAAGSGLAALGGGLAVDVLGLTPRFGLQYLVIFLIVVAVGGLGSIKGAFFAAIALGLIDNAGKYFLPQGGGFFIYAVTLLVLLWRPHGLFGRLEIHAEGTATRDHVSIPTWIRGKTFETVQGYLRARFRLRPIELLPWVLAIAVFFLLPGWRSFGSQVLIMVLFALSLDLAFGFAGLVTLGHAVFFGIGAYTAGLLAAKLGMSEPLSGLAIAVAVSALAGLISGAVLVRYRGLTFLMLTLAASVLVYEFANLRADITGGFDGLPGIAFEPIFNAFPLDDLWGRTPFLYALVVLAIGFILARFISTSWFGQSLVGVRENHDRMPALGCPVRWRLTLIYAIAAAMAGAAGALYTQTNAYVSLSVLSFERSGVVLTVLVLGGVGRLYGAIVGAVVYLVLDDQLGKIDPHIMEFGIGLTLVLIVLFAKGGILGIVDKLTFAVRR